ncbi:MAG TPA: helix-turn-helix domain-containing protein [Pseudonocardiaceae bacterium]
MEETFGQRLRRLRLELGLSQSALAGDALSASAVSLLESGQREPTLRTLATLADGLGCSPMFLRDGVEPAGKQGAALGLYIAEIDLCEHRLTNALAAFEGLTADQSLHGYLRDRARLGRALCLEELGHYTQAADELSAIRAAGRAASRHAAGWLTVEVALSRVQHKLGKRGQCMTLAEGSAKLADSLGLAGLGAHCEATMYMLIQWWYMRRSAEAVALAERYLDQPIPSPALDRARIYAAASAKAAAADRLDDAVELTQRALSLYADAEDGRAAAKLLGVCATVIIDFKPGRVRDAERALRSSRALFDRLGDQDYVAYCETGLAAAAVATGDLRRSFALADRALALMPDGPGLDRVRMLFILARAYRVARLEKKLRECLHTTRDMLRARPADSTTVFAWRELGALLGQMGEAAAGFEAYEIALSAARAD